MKLTRRSLLAILFVLMPLTLFAAGAKAPTDEVVALLKDEYTKIEEIKPVKPPVFPSNTQLIEDIPAEKPSHIGPVFYMDCTNVNGRILVPKDDLLVAFDNSMPGITDVSITLDEREWVWLRQSAEARRYTVNWTSEGTVELRGHDQVITVVPMVQELVGTSNSDAPNTSVSIVPMKSRELHPIAITFDDGPNPDCTEAILDILAKHNAKATFFHIGIYAKRYPALVRKVAESGQELGSHSMTHRDLTMLTGIELASEVATSKTIIEATAGSPVHLMRPPYGRHSNSVDSAVVDNDMTVALWTVDPRDWNTQDVHLIVSRVLNKAKSGDVVLLHETPATVTALPMILRGLEAKGMEIVSVSDLMSLGMNEAVKGL